MALIKEFIGSMNADITVGEFCRSVTLYINKVYDDADKQRLAAHPEERLTASCIVYSRVRNEIWMVGDCQCLVDGVLHENPKPYEAELAQRRAGIIKALLDSGGRTVDDIRRDDEGRKAIIPEMIATMLNQNKTYAVVDGFTIPMQHVKIVKPERGQRQIVLASDGYPFLHDTLEKSEAALREQLETDPLNIDLFKATKAYIQDNNSFDDRSYVRFLT